MRHFFISPLVLFVVNLVAAVVECFYVVVVVYEAFLNDVFSIVAGYPVACCCC